MATEEEIKLLNDVKEIVMGLENLRSVFRGDGGRQLLRRYLPWNVNGTMVYRWTDFTYYYRLYQRHLGRIWNTGNEILTYKKYVFYVYESSETFSVKIYFKSSTEYIKLFDGGEGYYGNFPLKYMVNEDHSLDTLPISKELLFQRIEEVKFHYLKAKDKIDEKIKKLDAKQRKKEENRFKNA